VAQGAADYTEAIRLDPKGNGAVYGRSNAYFRKGHNDRAIVEVFDLDEPLKV
jgi:hypothetical protein